VGSFFFVFTQKKKKKAAILVSQIKRNKQTKKSSSHFYLNSVLGRERLYLLFKIHLSSSRQHYEEFQKDIDLLSSPLMVAVLGVFSPVSVSSGLLYI
jgi:hypothetical protein